MAKKKATEKLQKQEAASELRNQNLNEDKAHEKADAKLLQDSIDAVQALDEDKVDPSLIEPGYSQVYHDTAEDADDEFDTGDDNEYVEVRPLNIKKAKTSGNSDQGTPSSASGVAVHRRREESVAEKTLSPRESRLKVHLLVHLSTNHPDQNAQTTAHSHIHVKGTDNLAQAEQSSAEVGHIAHLALEDNLPRVPTPYPKPLSVNRGSDLLHPSPPFRRRKGSKTPREKSSDSATDPSIMSNTGATQDAFHGHHQDHAVESTDNSNTYLTSNQRGKMPEARGNQNPFSGEGQEKTAEISQSHATFTSSEDQELKSDSSYFANVDAVLDKTEENKIATKKSMTDLVTSPKAAHGKKSLRRFFRRKGSKEATTPPSASGKTAGRKIISAPTLIDASPNAKNVVNFSRPIALHSSSDVSSGSPAVRGGRDTELRGSSSFSGPSATPEGLTDKSGNITVGLNASLIHDHSDPFIGHGKETADEHGAIAETLATEKNADASDSDSFNPSDYSGDENSVQQATPARIIFSGKPKLVDIRPPRKINTAAPAPRSDIGKANASGTTKLTDREAEALGAQDAERYYRNGLNAQTRSTTATSEDPIIDPAFQKLLAKPANEIAAREMARLKAARKAEKMGDGLMESMSALRAKSDAKPEAEKAGDAPAGFRTYNREALLSKMRALKKETKKEKEQEESGEEVTGKVQADVEPRIDYGPPNLHTALGGNGPTDAERAHARALTARGAAGQTGGRVQNNDDHTTARGQYEGY